MDPPYSLLRRAQAMSTLASDATQWEQMCRAVLRVGHGKTSSRLVTQTECTLVTGAQTGALQECIVHFIFIQKESSLPAVKTTHNAKQKLANQIPEKN